MGKVDEDMKEKELIDEVCVPLRIRMLLDVPRDKEMEIELDYKLYCWAKGNSSLRDIVKLLQKYGSPYTSLGMWRNWELGKALPNTLARNSIRRWANEELDFNIPYLPLTLSEMEQHYVDMNIEYMLTNDAEPRLVLVVDNEVDEVKVYRNPHDLSSETLTARVTTVTRRKQRDSGEQVQRLGISVSRPEPANSLLWIKRQLHISWDELMTDFVTDWKNTYNKNMEKATRHLPERKYD
jgi:hypothetical protein